jgi:hypothetical protein
VPSRPDARSPGPSGPEEFSPTGGSTRKAALTAAGMWRSCHTISSRTAPGRSGAASPAALAAYAAAPRACAPMCATAAACPAARAAAAAASVRASRAAAWPTKRRRISSATPSSPRAKARVRAIESRGRLSPGAAASNTPSTRSAQSAAHTATIRRSASLSVCGEATGRIFAAVSRTGLRVARRLPRARSPPRPTLNAAPTWPGASRGIRRAGVRSSGGAS